MRRKTLSVNAFIIILKVLEVLYENYISFTKKGIFMVL